jgi:hypothetical protein
MDTEAVNTQTANHKNLKRDKPNGSDARRKTKNGDNSPTKTNDRRIPGNTTHY